MAYPPVRVDCDGLDGEDLAIVQSMKRGLCHVDDGGTASPLNAVMSTDIWRDVGQALNDPDNDDRYIDVLPRMLELYESRVSGGDPNSPRLISIEFVDPGELWGGDASTRKLTDLNGYEASV